MKSEHEALGILNRLWAHAGNRDGALKLSQAGFYLMRMYGLEPN